MSLAQHRSSDEMTWAAPTMTAVGRALTVALVEGDELASYGLRQMLAPYAERMRLVGDSPWQGAPADLVLVDPTMSTGESFVADALGRAAPGGELVVYSWSSSSGPWGLRRLQALGWPVQAWLSKTLPARTLVPALERVHRGRVLVLDAPSRTVHGYHESPPAKEREAHATPGELSAREHEVLCLIAAGLTNQQIAEEMFLSINSVKTYIRSAYRKVGVTSRSHAILWALHHGLDQQQLDGLASDVESRHASGRRAGIPK